LDRKNIAVVFRGANAVAVEMEDAPRPGAGELLVETSVTLISTGTELTFLSGAELPGTVWASMTTFPLRPGYSNVGQVVEVGAGVGEEWVGRRVASCRPHARYVCAEPFPGSSSWVSVRPLDRDEVPDEQAAFFNLAETVMNGVRRSGVGWGDSVVVFGLGLLGQLAVRFCRLLGARPVFAVDVADERLRLLPGDSQIIPVNPTHDNARSLIEQKTAGRMADVAFEVTGNADLIPAEIQVLRYEGRFVVLSSPRGPGTLFNFHDLCNWPSYTIIGAHVQSHPEFETPANPWTASRNAELFFDLIADGELDVSGLITHRYLGSEAPRAYEMLIENRSQALGVLLLWNGEGTR